MLSLFTGKQRDDCLKTTEDLVKCYCLLDNHLQIRPGIVGQMQQEESLKIAQFENAETPDAAIGKTEYAQVRRRLSSCQPIS